MPRAATAPQRLTPGWLEGSIGRARYAVGFAQTEEVSSVFRTTSSGVFGTFTGTRSRFFTLGGDAPLASRASAFAVATTTIADPDTTPGLLSDWSDVRAGAYSVGLRFRDVLRDGDRVGIALGQPLRVEYAEADLAVPQALRADGGVAWSRERVHLEPGGREIDLEIAYGRRLGRAGSMSTFVGIARAPGHIAGAPPTAFAGLRLSMGF
ncbi:MAG: hypothetical protein FJX64_01465 [Alphaproteobacteria bacterium]|nr:hypothetical protein [Alphaproteobacteria bacterium]